MRLARFHPITVWAAGIFVMLGVLSLAWRETTLTAAPAAPAEEVIEEAEPKAKASAR